MSQWRNAEWEKKTDKINNASIRWYKPLIQALRDLGGSATRANTLKKIIQNEHLTTAEVSETRGKTGVSKFENDVSFARYDLVLGGYIDNSVRGIWTLTDAGKTVDMTDELAMEICRNVASDRANRGMQNEKKSWQAKQRFYSMV